MLTCPIKVIKSYKDMKLLCRLNMKPDLSIISLQHTETTTKISAASRADIKTDHLKRRRKTIWKGERITFKSFTCEKFRSDLIFLPAFHLSMWLMKSPKNFEKNGFLKIWELVSFWGVKTHCQNTPQIIHFQAYFLQLRRKPWQLSYFQNVFFFKIH